MRVILRLIFILDVRRYILGHGTLIILPMVSGNAFTRIRYLTLIRIIIGQEILFIYGLDSVFTNDALGVYDLEIIMTKL